jgi:hypothetical protein
VVVAVVENMASKGRSRTRSLWWWGPRSVSREQQRDAGIASEEDKEEEEEMEAAPPIRCSSAGIVTRLIVCQAAPLRQSLKKK